MLNNLTIFVFYSPWMLEYSHERIPKNRAPTVMSYTAVGPANKIGYVPSTLSKMECTARYSDLITNVYWLHTSTQILNRMRTP